MKIFKVNETKILNLNRKINKTNKTITILINSLQIIYSCRWTISEIKNIYVMIPKK